MDCWYPPDHLDVRSRPKHWLLPSHDVKQLSMASHMSMWFPLTNGSHLSYSTPVTTCAQNQNMDHACVAPIIVGTCDWGNIWCMSSTTFRSLRGLRQKRGHLWQRMRNLLLWILLSVPKVLNCAFCLIVLNFIVGYHYHSYITYVLPRLRNRWRDTGPPVLCV